MIFHILPREAWELARKVGEYRGDTLASEGFIHCSEQLQVVTVANARFRGSANLLLIGIEPKNLRWPLKYEDGGEGELFPHIYGPLNLDAVLRIVEFRPLKDGLFEFPSSILG